MRVSFVVPTLIGMDILDAKRNDWISLDLMECTFINHVSLGLVFLVDSATEDILHDAIFESSRDGVVWVIIVVMKLFENEANDYFYFAGRFEPSSDMYTSPKN